MPAAVQAFDDHFALPPGVCTRPANYDPWPDDLVSDLVEGLVPQDETCAHERSCQGDLRCVEIAPGDLICVPRLGFDQPCSSDDECLAGLLCLDDNLGGPTVCTQPRSQGEECDSAQECSAGLLCYPANLEEVLNTPFLSLDAPTCQPRLVTPGTVCLSSSALIPGVPFSTEQDLCAATQYCDEFAFGSTEDGVGRCVAAVADGGACSYCDELVNLRDPHIKHPFSVCTDGTVCSLTPDGGGGFGQSCRAQVSVCRVSELEAFGTPGQLCGSPTPGAD